MSSLYEPIQEIISKFSDIIKKLDSPFIKKYSNNVFEERYIKNILNADVEGKQQRQKNNGHTENFKNESTSELLRTENSQNSVLGYSKRFKDDQLKKTECSPTTAIYTIVIFFLIMASTIVVGVIMVYLVIPIFSKNATVCFGSNSTKTTFLAVESQQENNVNAEKTSYLDVLSQQQKITEVVVKSPLNLPKLTKNTTVIRIVRLTDPLTFPVPIIPVNFLTKELKLVGPISQTWLHFLMRTFTDIEELYIDSDKVCEGFKKEKNTIMSPVKMNKLHTLTVENSYNCPIMDWGFYVEMPNLKIVEVDNVILSGKNYNIFEEILRKAKKSLEGIEISKSYLCDTCDITDMEFDNMRYLKVTKRLDRDPRFSQI